MPAHCSGLPESKAMELGSVTLKKSPTSTAVGATTWKVKVLSAPFLVELVSSCALVKPTGVVSCREAVPL